MSDEPISLLTLDVLRVLLTKTGKASDGVLDFSPPRFALKATVQEGVPISALFGLKYATSCENEKEYFTRKVKKVILSGNDLSSRDEVGGNLYELRVFRRTLEQLFAVNCNLSSLGWNSEKIGSKKFQSLVELSLSRNFLTEVPDLSGCPRLRIVDLSRNEISRFANLQLAPYLLNVNLSENRIDFKSEGDFVADLRLSLAPFSSLLSLKLEKNPLTFNAQFRDRYRDMVMQSIEKCRLTFLDGAVNEEMIERARTLQSLPFVHHDPVLEEKEDFPSSVMVASAAATTTPVPPKNRNFEGDVVFPCTLSDLDAILEECFTSDSSSLHMEQLITECHKVVEASSSATSLFTKDEEAYAFVAIHNFLQRIMALSERRPDLLTSLLLVLIILVRVEEKNLGLNCFKQLKVFMTANAEIKMQVVQCVHSSMQFVSLQDLRLVKELVSIAESTDCPELLVGGAVPFVINQLKNPLLKNNADLKEICFYCLSVGTRDYKACTRVGEDHLGDLIVQEFEAAPSTSNPFFVVETIYNLCKANVRNGRKSNHLLFADFVVTPPCKVHKLLLRDLDESTPTRGDDDLMSLQIDVLSCLLERSRVAFADLCGGSTSNSFFHVLSKYFLPKTPSRLMAEAATYRAVSCLLGPATTNWCPLVMSSTLTRTRRDILEEMQRSVFHSEDVCLLLEYLTFDTKLYTEAWIALGKHETPPPPFKDLTDIKMHRLFVSQIDLIKSFNTSSQSGVILAKTIADRLNTRGREVRLFACLEIPSDAVRLAAVQCLDSVQLNQFDSDEIKFLLRLLREVTDVTIGRMEEVLAISLDILAKLARSSAITGFDRKYGKSAVEVCMRLLEMNVNRDTGNMGLTEQAQKRTLSAACLRLLLLLNFESDAISQRVNRILVLEDGLSDAVHTPVLVELTSRSVSQLVNVFAQVKPDGPVASRVLRRVANLLMTLPPALEGDAYKDTRQRVREDIANELIMSEWNPLHFAMLERNEKEEEERIQRHQEFSTACCLQSILIKLVKTLSKSQLLQQPAIQQGTKLKRLGDKSSTLQELVELHLMSEAERLLPASDLRSIPPPSLSMQEVNEAQRSDERTTASGEEKENGEEEHLLNTLSAAIRVLYASLMFGTQETRFLVRQTLREEAHFVSLLQVFFGSSQVPVYFRKQLGTKFFSLVEAVLCVSSLQRQESNLVVLKLDQWTFSCADRALGFLRKRVEVQGQLFANDEHLIQACMSCCAAMAHQLEYVLDDRGPETLFQQLVSSSLLSSTLHFLLLDMGEPSFRSQSQTVKNIWGEVVEDEAREVMILFLSYCLRHSPSHRYAILEFLLRSNITDPFPVRRIIIQELMKRTHKIGSMQRTALEFRLSSSPEEESEKDEIAVVMVPPPPPPVSSSHWNLIAWCTGSARKLEEKESRTAAVSSHSSEGRTSRAESLFASYSPPSSEPEWAERTGPRERVVSHSFVCVNVKRLVFEFCLVLTSESYYFFHVLEEDFDFPNRWTLLWKRPYRALVRVGFGSGRLHIYHRSSDATQDGELMTFFTPSRSSAKELALAFYDLSRAWYALWTSPQEINRGLPLVCIENCSSDKFRIANALFDARLPVTAASNHPLFCDLVRFCPGEIAGETWKVALAVIQKDKLLLLDKSESDWVLMDDDKIVKPCAVLATYELTSKSMKMTLKAADFALNQEPPTPALVLEFWTGENKRSVAIVFQDDCTRTVWKRYLLDTFKGFKLLVA